MDTVRISKKRLRQLVEAELLLEILTDGEMETAKAVEQFCQEEGFHSWDEAIDKWVQEEVI